MEKTSAIYAAGSNEKKVKVTIYRRGSKYGDWATGAIRVHAAGRLARASLLRIAAEVEEELEGLFCKAPVCIDTRGDDENPYLWIEGEATPADLEIELHVLTLAATKAGFRVEKI